VGQDPLFEFWDSESSDGSLEADGIFKSGAWQLTQKLASLDTISAPHLWQNI
jgi:hypothetical protein